jgi:hypothetical protein
MSHLKIDALGTECTVSDQLQSMGMNDTGYVLEYYSTES